MKARNNTGVGTDDELTMAVFVCVFGAWVIFGSRWHHPAPTRLGREKMITLVTSPHTNASDGTGPQNPAKPPGATATAGPRGACLRHHAVPSWTLGGGKAFGVWLGEGLPVGPHIPLVGPNNGGGAKGAAVPKAAQGGNAVWAPAVGWHLPPAGHLGLGACCHLHVPAWFAHHLRQPHWSKLMAQTPVRIAMWQTGSMWSCSRVYSIYRLRCITFYFLVHASLIILSPSVPKNCNCQCKATPQTPTVENRYIPILAPFNQSTIYLV